MNAIPPQTAPTPKRFACKDLAEATLLRLIGERWAALRARDREGQALFPREPNVVDQLVAMGVPEKVVYRKLEKLYERGLIECGVSIRGAWLTSRGEDALRKALVEAAP